MGSTWVIDLLVGVGCLGIVAWIAWVIYWLFMEPVNHSSTCSCQRCVWPLRRNLAKALRRGDVASIMKYQKQIDNRLERQRNED